MTAVAFAGSCKSAPVVSTFSLDSGSCGLVLTSPTWTGNGNSAFTGLQFRIQNDCDLSALTLNGLTLNWSGTVSTPNPNITLIKYNGVAYTGTLNSTTGAMGTAITFSSSQTAVIAAGGTSAVFDVSFSNNMTSDLSKNGTPYAFTSIKAAVTSPATSTEEIIDSPPVNP